jgi:enoyl-CoA hydratase/carnithine racemase
MSNPTEYQYKTANVSLGDDGVLTVQLHSRGKALQWTGLPHRELPMLFHQISADRSVRAVILTGTGDHFIELIPEFEESTAAGKATALQMDSGLFEGNMLMNALLAIDVPVIAAFNGPAPVHAELGLLGDIVLCTPDTYFQDAAHVPLGLVPGDGVQVIWPLLLGPNRARYFLLTGQKIDSAEALALGLVGEVVPPELLMDRAREHALRLAECNPVFIRNSRIVLVTPLRRAMAMDVPVGLALEAVASWSGAAWDGPYAPKSLSSL